VAILVGMRSLVRQPTHYTRLILLLMFATGVGMFGATFSATLGTSYEDRAGYESGADVRATIPDQSLAGADDLPDMLASIPADVTSVAARLGGSMVLGNNNGANVTILGVDPESLPEVAYLREDFSDLTIDQMMSPLAASSVESVSGPLLPADAHRLGMWINFSDIRGRVAVGLSLRDETGRISNRVIASVAPTEGEIDQWRFYTVNLTSGISRTGGRTSEPAPQGDVEVLGAFIAATGRIAGQRGVIHLGPAYASTEPFPADAVSPIEVLDASWPGVDPFVDFTDGQFQVAQGLRPVRVPDVARPVEDVPPGVQRALRYEWQDTGLSPGVRGLALALSIPTGTEFAPIHISRTLADGLAIDVGERLNLIVSSRYIPAEVVGVFDYFPTFDPGARDGFVVMDASRMLGSLNAAIPDRAATANEIWLSTSDTDATVEALETLGLTRIVSREALQLQQQDDPLIAAGWSGILAISFGAVLLLSAIGFIVYSYLTAQQRGLEFAILRTLGFSKPQIFSVVMFEHLFVIVTGMGLGTVVGLRIGSIMMGFLSTDETGAAVVPPFILGVSWPQVFAVWAILGTVFVVTIAAVVAMYFRLAVHRVLRIGDA
jgi:hypothetical protein